jgi:hypothetical protein
VGLRAWEAWRLAWRGVAWRGVAWRGVAWRLARRSGGRGASARPPRGPDPESARGESSARPPRRRYRAARAPPASPAAPAPRARRAGHSARRTGRGRGGKPPSGPAAGRTKRSRPRGGGLGGEGVGGRRGRVCGSACLGLLAEAGSATPAPAAGCPATRPAARTLAARRQQHVGLRDPARGGALDAALHLCQDAAAQRAALAPPAVAAAALRCRWLIRRARAAGRWTRRARRLARLPCTLRRRHRRRRRALFAHAPPLAQRAARSPRGLRRLGLHQGQEAPIQERPVVGRELADHALHRARVEAVVDLAG